MALYFVFGVRNLLEKTHRLRKNSEFKFVYRYGRACSNEWMILRYVYLEELQKERPVRIGISVSKKVGGAVVRNKVKRRIAASLYDYANRLPDKCCLIFIAKNGLKDASFGQTKEAVLQLLRRAKLLNGGSGRVRETDRK